MALDLIHLLIHILGLVVSQDPTSPARQRNITVSNLEVAINNNMASWLDKPTNASKRSFLSQLFRVLYLEERYRRGELNGSDKVSIDDRANLSPEPLYQAPFPPPSISSSRPLISTTTSIDNYLPVRPFHVPNTTTRENYTSAPYNPRYTLPTSLPPTSLPPHQRQGAVLLPPPVVRNDNRFEPFAR